MNFFKWLFGRRSGIYNAIIYFDPKHTKFVKVDIHGCTLIDMTNSDDVDFLKTFADKNKLRECVIASKILPQSTHIECGIHSVIVKCSEYIPPTVHI